jgi:hypothetical protein
MQDQSSTSMTRLRLKVQCRGMITMHADELMGLVDEKRQWALLGMDKHDQWSRRPVELRCAECGTVVHTSTPEQLVEEISAADDLDGAWARLGGSLCEKGRG